MDFIVSFHRLRIQVMEYTFSWNEEKNLDGKNSKFVLQNTAQHL